jgi:hypothetical protein
VPAQSPGPPAGSPPRGRRARSVTTILSGCHGHYDGARDPSVACQRRLSCHHMLPASYNTTVRRTGGLVPRSPGSGPARPGLGTVIFRNEHTHLHKTSLDVVFIFLSMDQSFEQSRNVNYIDFTSFGASGNRWQQLCPANISHRACTVLLISAILNVCWFFMIFFFQPGFEGWFISSMTWRLLFFLWMTWTVAFDAKLSRFRLHW